MKNRIILFITIIVCFSPSVHSNGPYFHWIHHSKSASDPVCIHGTYAWKKSRSVDWIFFRAFVDLFYGSLFGFYALIYMYIGFISGYAFRSFYDDDLKVPLFLVAGTDLLYNLAVYGLQFLLRGRLGFWTYIYRIIIPEIVYTVFLTIIVYRVFYWINYHLMDTVRKESESIWELK